MKNNNIHFIQFSPLFILPISVIAIIYFIISNNINELNFKVNILKDEILKTQIEKLKTNVNNIPLLIQYQKSVLSDDINKEKNTKKIFKSLRDTYNKNRNTLFIINTKNNMLINNYQDINYKIFKQTYMTIKKNIYKAQEHSKLYKQTLNNDEILYIYYRYLQNEKILVFSYINKSYVLLLLKNEITSLKLTYQTNFNKIILISLFILVVSIIISFIISELINESFKTYKFNINKSQKELENLNNSLELVIENRTKKIMNQKDELYFQANHDNLTKLANRTLFHVTLDSAIKKAKRNNTGIALFFMDLDNFKTINDTLGHDFGDEILIQSAKRITSRIRDVDTVCRLGGDEFTIIMENLSEASDASILAQKVINDLSKPFIVEGHTLYISCSIGISFYPDDDTLAQNLIKFADTAMYSAKDNGKGRFQYYSKQMTQIALDKIALETSLRSAIHNNEFIVHYQALMNSNTEIISGVEALIRWNHPKKGLILPDDFLYIAIKNNFIMDIDYWIMKTAMRDVKSWYEMGYNPGLLSLNLTIKHIENKNFLANLKQIIFETNFKTQWLRFEINEEQIMKNPKKTLQILQTLSNLDIKISIDDFGSGYSSLSYLHDLPIDELKIDKSLIQNITNDDASIKITKTILNIANGLNLNTVAKGVETKEQKRLLEDMGCDNIQGYYNNKSCVADKIEEILQNNVAKLCG